MSELFAEGVQLMVFGMGTVFVFLTILVFATGLMSTIIQKYFPEQAPTEVSKSTAQNQADPQLLKVLKEAVKQYKNQRK